MKQIITVFVGLIGFVSATGALAASDQYEATSLVDNVLLISGPSGNTLVAIEDDGLVLIDGVPAADAHAYLEFIYQETGLDQVSTLVNTHWHPEQGGLNVILGGQGAKIVAHENTKQWLASTIRKRGEEIIHTPSPVESLPNDTTYTTSSLPFNNSRIDYGYLVQAHTDGDIYVFFPEENILVTGGVVRSDDWVVMDIVTGGFLGGMLDAYEVLLTVSNDDTVIVPISGPVMTRAELQAQYTMYKAVMVSLVDLLHESKSVAEVVAAAPVADIHPEWVSADAFLDQGFRSFYGHLRNGRHVGVMP